MIGVQTKFTPAQAKFKAAVGKAKFENIQHAALSIRKLAWSRIGKSKAGELKRDNRGKFKKSLVRPSAPGTPPHTPTGAYKKALWVDVDKIKSDAVIGFRKSFIGMSASMHEHGLPDKSGKFTFPKRPTIGPALDDSLQRIGDQWKGSIGA